MVHHDHHLKCNTQCESTIKKNHTEKLKKRRIYSEYTLILNRRVSKVRLIRKHCFIEQQHRADEGERKQENESENGKKKQELQEEEAATAAAAEAVKK